jgi:pilus assembly protein FimV
MKRQKHLQPRHRDLIVLDEYEDREKDEESHGRSAVIERTAASTGVEKTELKKMIGYLDQLFDKLPEETIREFSSSEYFDLYKRIMRDLDLS